MSPEEPLTKTSQRTNHPPDGQEGPLYQSTAGRGAGRGQIRFLVSRSRATRDYGQWKTAASLDRTYRRKVINGETRASPAGHLLFNCRNLIRRPNTVRSTKPNHARRANAAGETCETPDTRSAPEAPLKSSFEETSVSLILFRANCFVGN